MKKLWFLVVLLVFAIGLIAQNAAPVDPAAKTDAKTCAGCTDKAKCQECCKNGCKDCKDAGGKPMDCCKGKDSKMACARGKDTKMECPGMKAGKMGSGKMANGCCGRKCDRKAHSAKSGM
jgi:hypothetical protein